MVVYSDRTADAFLLAMALHASQRRKGTETPYVTHLWTVAALVGEHGGDEDQVIAAFLHDAIEDQGDNISLEQIARQFGDRVAGIVKGCTENEQKPKPPWKERKEAYLEHLRSASFDIKLVAAADKVHNAESLICDWHQIAPRSGRALMRGVISSCGSIAAWYRP